MSDTTRLVGSIIVSTVLLIAGLWVLLHGHSAADLQKAATGWIGLVAGYWLR